MATPEDDVTGLVVARTKVPGGPWFVEVKGPQQEPFFLGPYDNRGVARDDAAKIRRLVAAVIAKARPAGANLPPNSSFVVAMPRATAG